MGALKLIDIIDAKRVTWSQRLNSLAPTTFYGYLVVVCFFCTLVFYFPDVDLIQKNCKMYEYADRQIENPFSPDSYQSQGSISPNNHFNKRAFRLTVPLVAKMLSLNAMQVFYFQIALLPLFFLLLAKIFEKLRLDRLCVAFFTLSFCFLYQSKSFLFYLPLYDCFGYLMLLILILTKTPYLRFICYVTLFFIDERCLIAACLLHLLQVLVRAHPEYRTPRALLVHSENGILIGSLLFWGMTRYFLQQRFGLKVELTDENGVGFGMLRQNFGLMPMGTLFSLEGWWMIVLLCLLLLWVKKDFLLFSAIIMTAGLLSIIAFCVADINKSMAYVFVIIFIAVDQLRLHFQSEKVMQYLAIGTCLGCFILPTYLLWGGSSNKLYWLSPILPKILRYL